MHNLSLTHSTFSYITVPCSYNFLRYPAHGMLSFGCLLQSHILSAGARGRSQASRQLVCLTFVPPPSHSLNLGLQKQQPGCTQHPPSLPLDTAIKQSTVYSKMTHYLIKHTAGKQMMSCRITKDLSISVQSMHINYYLLKKILVIFIVTQIHFVGEINLHIAY